MKEKLLERTKGSRKRSIRREKTSTHPKGGEFMCVKEENYWGKNQTTKEKKTTTLEV
jgi:hypothetical protein